VFFRILDDGLHSEMLMTPNTFICLKVENKEEQNRKKRKNKRIMRKNRMARRKKEKGKENSIKGCKEEIREG
jgi:hypothetical protein